MDAVAFSLIKAAPQVRLNATALFLNGAAILINAAINFNSYKIPPKESKSREEIDDNRTPVHHGGVGGNRDNQKEKVDEKAQGKDWLSTNMDKGVKGLLPHQQVLQPSDFSSDSEALEKL